MCVFCKIADHELPARIVRDEGDVLAFHDVNPQAPTHVLVIPRKHIASLNDATEQDGELLGRVLACARRVAAELGLEQSGYRLVINTGRGAGQSVFHLHAHVLGGRGMGWPPG